MVNKAVYALGHRRIILVCSDPHTVVYGVVGQSSDKVYGVVVFIPGCDCFYSMLWVLWVDKVDAAAPCTNPQSSLPVGGDGANRVVGKSAAFVCIMDEAVASTAFLFSPPSTVPTHKFPLLSS